eukprot:1806694-Prymnesium_polylepis.1
MGFEHEAVDLQCMVGPCDARDAVGTLSLLKNADARVLEAECALRCDGDGVGCELRKRYLDDDHRLFNPGRMMLPPPVVRRRGGGRGGGRGRRRHRVSEVAAVLGGLGELSDAAIEILAEHVSGPENWAAEASEKQKDARAKAASSGSQGGSQGGGGEGALEEYKEAFVPPFPDVDGVCPGQLVKAVVLLTGTFAEMASAAAGALDEGKAQVKQLVELFGGRVVSGMSKRVTHLVLGRAPGASKLAAARSAGVALVTLETLCLGLRQNDVDAA